MLDGTGKLVCVQRRTASWGEERSARNVNMDKGHSARMSPSRKWVLLSRINRSILPQVESREGFRQGLLILEAISPRYRSDKAAVELKRGGGRGMGEPREGFARARLNEVQYGSSGMAGETADSAC